MSRFQVKYLRQSRRLDGYALKGRLKTMSRPRRLGTKVLQLLNIESESISETQDSDSKNTGGLLVSKFKRILKTRIMPVITIDICSIYYSPEAELSVT